jgi:hypothetical protein
MRVIPLPPFNSLAIAIASQDQAVESLVDSYCAGPDQLEARSGARKEGQARVNLPVSDRCARRCEMNCHAISMMETAQKAVDVLPGGT